MPLSSRPYFELRRGERHGDRLVWRRPFNDPKVRRQLEPVGGESLPRPNQITIGYYYPVEAPVGSWAFAPLNQPWSIAALQVPMVQRRICADLARYLAQPATAQKDEPSTDA